jgi:hypothetical protein
MQFIPWTLVMVVDKPKGLARWNLHIRPPDPEIRQISIGSNSLKSVVVHVSGSIVT